MNFKIFRIAVLFRRPTHILLRMHEKIISKTIFCFITSTYSQVFVSSNLRNSKHDWLILLIQVWRDKYLRTYEVWRQKRQPEVFCKKRCSSKLRKIHGKTPVSQPKAYNFFKKDSTGVFLWILRHFLEHLFYITLSDDCFYKVLFVIKWKFWLWFISEMISCELRVVSCHIKNMNLEVASYFLPVAVLK